MTVRHASRSGLPPSQIALQAGTHSKEAYQRRLVKQLERMGYDVTLAEKAA